MKSKSALVLKSVKADMTGTNGFKYPEKGKVACEDWEPTALCGNGLHGLLWGEGDYSLLNWSVGAKWLVIRILKYVEIDKEKVKFESGTVVYCGDRVGAADYIRAHGNKKLLFSGTATAGDRGTATAGYMGIATAGYKGTATAGNYGAIVIEGWDGKNRIKRCAQVGGKDGLKPKTKYKLNEKLEFVEVKS